MDIPEDMRKKLEIIAAILLRCLIASVIFLLIWFFGFLIGKNIAFVMDIHYSLFKATAEDFNMVNYWGIAFFKLIGIAFFLIPWISIKLVLRKHGNTD